MKSESLSLQEVQQRMLDKLSGSSLDSTDARAMRLQPVVAADAKRKWHLPAESACFLIPYFDLEGNVTRFYRARYVEDTRKGFSRIAGVKPIRYAQPVGAPSEVYFPPNGSMNWAALAEDVEMPLVITEGELKAACACKHGIATIGLGGVWSFQSKKQGQPLIPVFDEIKWEDRLVYIVFDSDAATNPDVVNAELRLSRRLLERGAVVRVGRIPMSEEVEKVGIDDFIMLNGVAEFKELVMERAFEHQPSKELHELNKRVIYVRDPGFVWDHEMNMKMTPGAFKEHAFSNVFLSEVRVTKNGEVMVRVPAAKAWLEWGHRTEARGITFAPGKERVTPQGLLNTWEGWGVSEPVAGDMEPWHEILRHVFGADAEARTWFEAWCAYPLQHPGTKLKTATAIWSVEHGAGKSLIGYTLMRIYGKHAAELKDTDLESERQEWAENKQFVLADDIVAKGDRKLMRKLMTMVTQMFIRLDPKYVPSYSVPDLINYYYTSNEPDALYMEDHDRRFWVFESLAGKFLAYKRYVAWMESDDGIAALWHYFLALDIEWFDPNAPAPETQSKRDMIEMGKSDLGAWVRELRDMPNKVLDRGGLRGDLYSAKELHALYDPSGDKKASTNALSRELKRAGFRPPANGSKLHLKDGTQVMAYMVRNQAKWREATWKEACAHYEATWAGAAGAKRGKY